MAGTIAILARALTRTALASGYYTTSNGGPGNLAMSSNPHRWPEFLRKVRALFMAPAAGTSTWRNDAP